MMLKADRLGWEYRATMIPDIERTIAPTESGFVSFQDLIPEPEQDLPRFKPVMLTYTADKLAEIERAFELKRHMRRCLVDDEYAAFTNDDYCGEAGMYGSISFEEWTSGTK